MTADAAAQAALVLHHKIFDRKTAQQVRSIDQQPRIVGKQTLRIWGNVSSRHQQAGLNIGGQVAVMMTSENRHLRFIPVIFAA